MFDPEGERAFIRECRKVLDARTVILITHRPESLKLADRILRLDQGRLLASWPQQAVAAESAPFG